MNKASRVGTAILLLSLAPSVLLADERIVLQRGNFGDDREFIERYVVGQYSEYGVFKLNKVDPNNLYIGRYDLNSDGIEELLVYIAYGFVCGTVGCETVIFQKTEGKWTELSSLQVWFNTVDEQYLYVTEEKSADYKTLYSEYYGLRWNGKEYEGFCRRDCPSG